MIATVKFSIDPPTNCTQKEFLEWLQWCLKARNDIKLSNPLNDYELDLTELKLDISINQ